MNMLLHLIRKYTEKRLAVHKVSNYYIIKYGVVGEFANNYYETLTI